MTQLTDTQLVLLSTTLGRDTGSLLPLPTTLLDPAAAPAAIKQLIQSGYAQERAVNAKNLVWRTGDDERFGAFLTDWGQRVLTSDADRPAGDFNAKDTELAPPSGRTRDSAIALLQRDGGATIDDLTTATGWLSHSARAALSGLRKSGHTIERLKADGGTRYFIAGAGR